MIKERAKQFIRYKQVKKFFEKNERVLIPAMLIVGVAVDFITFRSIQISIAFSILFVYTIVAGATIVFLNLYKEYWSLNPNFVTRYYRLVAPLIIQFTFGALLSASLIFYWFSGVLSVSWPFILIIAILIVSNDVFREHYLKPTVQISVYFFIIFSIISLILPFLLNSISPWIFLISGLVAFGFIYLFVNQLSKRSLLVLEHRSILLKSISVIFILMNGLYFFNVLPPIPLALRDAGVYHNLQRIQGSYYLETEPESIIEKIVPGQIIHVQGSKSVYVFSSIFAPADLNTTIVHDWEFFDVTKREWISKSKPSYKISGGREGGYRGFSRAVIVPGEWRVSVQTLRGQTLGRVKFKAIYSEDVLEYKQIIK